MLRTWSVYGISSVLSRSIAFLLLPVYTRVLSPEEYGIRAMVGLGLEIVGLLFAFGLKEAINRFYAGADGTPRAEAASTGLIAHMALIGAGAALGLVSAPWLAPLLLGDATLAPFLRLGLVAFFFAHVQEAALIYLRARRRAVLVAGISVANLLAMVCLNLVFVVALRWGVAGIFYAEIVVLGVSGTVLTVRALREIGTTFVPAIALRMARFGTPLMFLPLAWLLVNRADVMFVTHYGSLAAVGIYALAVQCAQVLMITLVDPFRNFWDPMQFDVARDPDGPRTYRRIFQWFTFASIVAAFAGAVAVDDVIRIMAAPAFHTAAVVVPVLLIAYALSGIHLLFNTALLVHNRTTLIAAMAIVTAAVNITVNAWLVPHYLAMGAAIARVATMATMVVVTFVLAQRLWRPRPDFVALAKIGTLAVTLFVVSRFLPDLPVVSSLAVKAALVALLVALGVWSGAVDRRDVAAAWSLVRGRLLKPGASKAPSPPDARPVPAKPGRASVTRP
ncbi:MAG: oligosaccharide flippase family protein [Candidatus Rokubacteria bacterium]|nr:oligosaccharide flippase family protein [Candidatus Rokubacteria bacterium]